MFTGLIEQTGMIAATADSPAGREIRVDCAFDDVVIGESIAVNGACLTVREAGPGWFTVAAAAMTLERTAIGTWEPGRSVHLERALRLADRLGGHFVQGHVDGVGTVRGVVRSGSATLLDLALPAGLSTLLVPLGSVAVDGVSLTVNALPDPETLQVALIEHTLRHTLLGDLAPGDVVHIEADMIAKYVHHMVAPSKDTVAPATAGTSERRGSLAT